MRGQIKEIGVDAACIAAGDCIRRQNGSDMVTSRRAVGADDPRANQQGKRRQALSPDGRWLAAGGWDASWGRGSIPNSNDSRD
jgi:hypothetical protein